MRLDHRGPFEAVNKEGGVHPITVVYSSRRTNQGERNECSFNPKVQGLTGMSRCTY